MSGVKIVKSKDRCSCNVCKRHFISPDSLYELDFSSINVCLCTDCFKETRTKMYLRYDLDKQVKESEKE